MRVKKKKNLLVYKMKRKEMKCQKKTWMLKKMKNTIKKKDYLDGIQRHLQGECWVYVIFFAWSLTPSSTSSTRNVPALEGGSPLGPPLLVFRALAPKMLSAMLIWGFGGGAPQKKISVVFGGIMASGFAIHGIGFFGPWFSNFGIGIRVSEVG